MLLDMRSFWRTLDHGSLRDISLVCLADAIVGASFGAITVSGGLHPWVPVTMSALVFAGGAQFAAAGVVVIGVALGVLGVALGLVLFALRDNVVFFYGPTEMVEKHVGPGQRLRIGGLVGTGSLVHGEGKSVTFNVTDGKAEVPVAYTGLLPDLFREGQGVVAEGALDKVGVFRADSILAKHDERYMPREVADALKKQGVWQEQGRKAEGGAQ